MFNIICELLICIFCGKFLLTSLLIGLGLYYLITANNKYFEKRNVKYVKPVFFLGSLADAILQKKTYMETYIEILNSFPEQGFIGIYDFLKPLYVLKDPDLIKQVCIKDGDNFINHRFTLDPEVDPIVGRNLFAIKDQRWRDMRHILTPAFTSAKMRFMFQLVHECTERTIKFIDENRTENGIFLFEAVDFLSRYANDIIATTAFGLEINSVKYQKDEFYRQGRIISCLATVKFTIKFIIANTLPWVMKTFKIAILDKNAIEYFRKIILSTLRIREQSDTMRPDLIHLLLQAKTKGRILDENEKDDMLDKDKKAHTMVWTDDDFVAQCLIFFMAGFETSSTTMTFMAYELALNQDIQDTLIKQIDELLENLKGKPPTYEDIHKLKYLDMVLSETLRKWTPVTGVDRVCNKPYILEDSSGQKCLLQPGDAIFIPLLALHYNEEQYPNPTKFDPSRFENTENINSRAYYPFGVGPRQCIGSRFSIMEIKIFFFYLLSKYVIQTNEGTEIPAKLKLGSFNITPETGIKLEFKSRN